MLLRWLKFLVIALAAGVVIFLYQAGYTLDYHSAQLTPANPRPVIEVGRNLQELKKTAEGSLLPPRGQAATPSFRQEVKEVVEEQRRLVQEEMVNYNYPSGRYGKEASKLEDLLMDTGGQPIRSLVVTTWRSGSTFVGDVLLSHPATYYHYEPLLDFEIIQVRSGKLARRAVSVLRSLLQCNYTTLDHYLAYGQKHTWLFLHNRRLWSQCQKHQHVCWDSSYLNSMCRVFPFQSMKTVRLRLNLTQELLDDPSLGVRVLLLVRDPRATMQSRKHRVWCPGNPDCWDPAKLCSDMVSDYITAKQMKNEYRNRFKVIRYEDFSQNPYQGVEQLFQFYALDFHHQVKRFLDTHTKVNRGGVSSTYRDSKSAPFQWQHKLSFQEVVTVQNKCRVAMQLWGYVPAKGPKHLKKFYPLKEFTWKDDFK